MRKTNQKRRIIAVIFMIAVLAVTIIPRGKTLLELTFRKKALEQEKQQLTQANQELAEQVKELQSPEAVERLAREKLGMVKKGERIIMEVKEDN